MGVDSSRWLWTRIQAEELLEEEPVVAARALHLWQKSSDIGPITQGGKISEGPKHMKKELRL